MVVAGTRMTFQVQGTEKGLYLISASADANRIRGEVITRLSRWFVVESVTVRIGTLIDRVTTGEWFIYPYSATVVASPRSNYGAPGDLASVVANAFYQAVDGVAVDDAMPTVVVSDQVLPIDAVGQVGTTVGDIVDEAKRTIGGVGIVLIVGILALAYILANGKQKVIPL